MLERGFDFIEALIRDLIDVETIGQKGPSDDLARIVQHNNFSLVRGLENIGVAPDVIFDEVGIHDDSDSASHEGNAEFVTRIEWLIQKLRVDVFQVGNF